MVYGTPVPVVAQAAGPAAQAAQAVVTGRTLMAAEEPARAAEEFGRAVVLDATNLAAWSGLGEARLALAHWRSACYAFERALELRPDDVELLVDRGRALAGAGDDDAAAAAYQRAIQLDPSNVGAQEGLTALGRPVPVPGSQKRGEAAASVDTAVDGNDAPTPWRQRAESEGSGHDRPTSENTADACRDQRDNDGDGFFDCNDPDCGDFAFCPRSRVAPIRAQARTAPAVGVSTAARDAGRAPPEPEHDGTLQTLGAILLIGGGLAVLAGGLLLTDAGSALVSSGTLLHSRLDLSLGLFIGGGAGALVGFVMVLAGN